MRDLKEIIKSNRAAVKAGVVKAGQLVGTAVEAPTSPATARKGFRAISVATGRTLATSATLCGLSSYSQAAKAGEVRIEGKS